eukprot:gene11027-12191_t
MNDFTKSREPEDYVKSFPKVILFGDSLTQKGFWEGGWCLKLVADYVRRCDIINRGFSGYTTRMSKHIIKNILKEANHPNGSIYAAILLLGSNDSVIKSIDDRAVPIDEYKENLKEILDEMQNHGIPKNRILLVSPPPIDEVAWGEFAAEQGYDQAYSNNAVSDYATACTEVSQELQLANHLNLWTEIQKVNNWKECFMDGLHFGQKGHEVMYNLIKSKLEPILRPLKIVYPDYKDINPMNPEKSLAH